MSPFGDFDGRTTGEGGKLRLAVPCLALCRVPAPFSVPSRPSPVAPAPRPLSPDAVPAPGRAGPPSPKRFVRLEATESYTVREGSGWIEWMVCWRMRPVEGEKV